MTLAQALYHHYSLFISHDLGIQISKKNFRKNWNFINLGWFLEVNVKISSLKVIWKIDWEIVFETRQNFQNNICFLNISL